MGGFSDKLESDMIVEWKDKYIQYKILSTLISALDPSATNTKAIAQRSYALLSISHPLRSDVTQFPPNPALDTNIHSPSVDYTKGIDLPNSNGTHHISNQPHLSSSISSSQSSTASIISTVSSADIQQNSHHHHHHQQRQDKHHQGDSQQHHHHHHQHQQHYSLRVDGKKSRSRPSKPPLFVHSATPSLLNQNIISYPGASPNIYPFDDSLFAPSESGQNVNNKDIIFQSSQPNLSSFISPQDDIINSSNGIGAIPSPTNSQQQQQQQQPISLISPPQQFPFSPSHQIQLQQLPQLTSPHNTTSLESTAQQLFSPPSPKLSSPIPIVVPPSTSLQQLTAPLSNSFPYSNDVDLPPTILEDYENEDESTHLPYNDTASNISPTLTSNYATKEQNITNNIINDEKSNTNMNNYSNDSSEVNITYPESSSIAPSATTNQSIDSLHILTQDEYLQPHRQIDMNSLSNDKYNQIDALSVSETPNNQQSRVDISLSTIPNMTTLLNPTSYSVDSFKQLPPQQQQQQQQQQQYQQSSNSNPRPIHSTLSTTGSYFDANINSPLPPPPPQQQQQQPQFSTLSNHYYAASISTSNTAVSTASSSTRQHEDMATAYYDQQSQRMGTGLNSLSQIKNFESRLREKTYYNNNDGNNTNNNQSRGSFSHKISSSPSLQSSYAPSVTSTLSHLSFSQQRNMNNTNRLASRYRSSIHSQSGFLKENQNYNNNNKNNFNNNNNTVNSTTNQGNKTPRNRTRMKRTRSRISRRINPQNADVDSQNGDADTTEIDNDYNASIRFGLPNDNVVHENDNNYNDNKPAKNTTPAALSPSLSRRASKLSTHKKPSTATLQPSSLKQPDKLPSLLNLGMNSLAPPSSQKLSQLLLGVVDDNSSFDSTDEDDDGDDDDDDDEEEDSNDNDSNSSVSDNSDDDDRSGHITNVNTFDKPSYFQQPIKINPHHKLNFPFQQQSYAAISTNSHLNKLHNINDMDTLSTSMSEVSSSTSTEYNQELSVGPKQNNSLIYNKNAANTKTTQYDNTPPPTTTTTNNNNNNNTMTRNMYSSHNNFPSKRPSDHDMIFPNVNRNNYDNKSVIKHAPSIYQNASSSTNNKSVSRISSAFSPDNENEDLKYYLEGPYSVLNDTCKLYHERTLHPHSIFPLAMLNQNANILNQASQLRNGLTQQFQIPEQIPTYYQNDGSSIDGSMLAKNITSAYDDDDNDNNNINNKQQQQVSNRVIPKYSNRRINGIHIPMVIPNHKDAKPSMLEFLKEKLGIHFDVDPASLFNPKTIHIKKNYVNKNDSDNETSQPLRGSQFNTSQQNRQSGHDATNFDDIDVNAGDLQRILENMLSYQHIPVLHRDIKFYKTLTAECKELRRLNREDIIPTVHLISPEDRINEIYPLQLRDPEIISQELSDMPNFVTMLPQGCEKYTIESLYCNALQSQLELFNEFTLLLEQYYDGHLYNVATMLARLEYDEQVVRQSCIDVLQVDITQFITDRDQKLDQIKKTLKEVHRGLIMLNDYIQLNIDGLVHIMKKHDEISPSFGYSMQIFLPIVFSTHFAQTTAGEMMTTYNEMLFSRAFGHDLTQHFLQQKDSHDTPFAWLRFGFFFGVVTSLIIANLILFCLFPHQSVDSTVFLAAFPIFRALAYITVLMWVWGIVTWICEKYRINYQLVLQLNPHNYIRPMQTFELSAFFSMILLICFTLFMFSTSYDQQSPIQRYVLYITVLIFVGAVFLPLPILYHRTRLYMLSRIVYVILSPFTPATIQESLVGDIMTSLTRFLYDVSYLACFYGHFSVDSGHSSIEYHYCSNAVKQYAWWIKCVPQYFRFLQNVRNIYFSGEWYPFSVNALKYALSLPDVVFSWFLVRSGYEYRLLIPWLFFVAWCQILSWWWDTSMDWQIPTRFQAANDNYEDLLKKLEDNQSSYPYISPYPVEYQKHQNIQKIGQFSNILAPLNNYISKHVHQVAAKTTEGKGNNTSLSSASSVSSASSSLHDINRHNEYSTHTNHAHDVELGYDDGHSNNSIKPMSKYREYMLKHANIIHFAPYKYSISENFFIRWVQSYCCKRTTDQYNNDYDDDDNDAIINYFIERKKLQTSNNEENNEQHHSFEQKLTYSTTLLSLWYFFYTYIIVPWKYLLSVLYWPAFWVMCLWGYLIAIMPIRSLCMHIYFIVETIINKFSQCSICQRKTKISKTPPKQTFHKKNQSTAVEMHQYSHKNGDNDDDINDGNNNNNSNSNSVVNNTNNSKSDVNISLNNSNSNDFNQGLLSSPNQIPSSSSQPDSKINSNSSLHNLEMSISPTTSTTINEKSRSPCDQTTSISNTKNDNNNYNYNNNVKNKNSNPQYFSDSPPTLVRMRSRSIDTSLPPLPQSKQIFNTNIKSKNQKISLFAPPPPSSPHSPNSPETHQQLDKYNHLHEQHNCIQETVSLTDSHHQDSDDIYDESPKKEPKKVALLTNEATKKIENFENQNEENHKDQESLCEVDESTFASKISSFCCHNIPESSISRSYWSRQVPTKYEFAKTPIFPAFLLPHELCSTVFNFPLLVYYICIILDLILRFTFVFSSHPDIAKKLFNITSDWLSFVLGILELFRRGMWIVLRIENEHLKLTKRLKAITLEGEIA